jgi:hypothetical protein
MTFWGYSITEGKTSIIVLAFVIMPFVIIMKLSVVSRFIIVLTW